MRHGVHKVKFTKGQDSHQALMRKLVLNFIRHGKIETTASKAKAIKSAVDRLTGKAIRNSSSDQIMLTKYLGKKSAVSFMIQNVGPSFSTRKTGFTTMKKLGKRQGDSAEVVRIQWVENIIAAEEPIVKAPVAKADKSTKPAKKKAETVAKTQAAKETVSSSTKKQVKAKSKA